MTTPAALSGVTTTFKIDGIDMHTYGMVANIVRNPVPRARPKKVSIPNLDGDLDFTNRYDTRIITIEGKIIADNHSQLLANIDEINKLLLLKEDASAIYLIFNDQPTRQWACRYDGAFDVEHESLWYSGRIARFSLQFACLKIYAESTTVTSETFNLSVLGQKQITYNGSYPAPIQIAMSANMKENLLEKVAGDCSESGVPWTSSGCAVGTLNTTSPMFGSASVKVVDALSDGGSFSIDITSSVIVSPRSGIVAGCYVKAQSAGDLAKIKVLVQHNGSGDGSPVYFSSTNNSLIGYAFKKVSASDLATATSAVFSIAHDAGVAEYEIDGAFVYTISQSEFLDSSYLPPPYISDTSGDDRQPLVNPNLLLYKNSNLIEYSKGNSTDGWTSGIPSVVPDPLSSGSKCLMLKTTSTVVSCSPIFFMQPNSSYRIKFEYYLKKIPLGISGIFSAGVDERPEGNLSSLLWNEVLPFTTNTPTTSWTNGSISFTSSSSGNIGKVVFALGLNNSQSSDCELFIRNIQVEQTSSATSYKNSDISKIEWVGTLSCYSNGVDILIIDGERFIASKYASQTNALTNAMSGILQFDRMVLKPGFNTFRLIDARYGSSTPETASCGSAEITLSYRERYL